MEPSTLPLSPPPTGRPVASTRTRRTSEAPNYTVVRTARALELLCFGPTSAPALADALGIDARTARRLLRALVSEQYVERQPATGRHGSAYTATVRLLALAAQLARRLPLIRHGDHAVHDLHEHTGLATCLTIPAYEHVLVLASAGSDAPRPWELQPAAQTAAGLVLLANRDAWRRSLSPRDPTERAAAEIRSLGYALRSSDSDALLWLAVPVGTTDPIAAIALIGPPRRITDDEPRLASLLRSAAARLALQCAPTIPHENGDHGQ